MISIDGKESTQKHGVELFKDHDNSEEFFFHGVVILLQLSQFTRPIRNRSFMLDDYGAPLVVRNIHVNMEWIVEVGVCHEDIYSQDSFYDFKGIVSFWSPTKGHFTRFIRQWF